MTTTPTTSTRRRPLRLGLRVMLAVALVTASITGVLAVVTFRLASSYMLDQRQTIAVQQATVNARLVETALRRDVTDLAPLLTGLGSDVESAVLLIDKGKRISSGGLVDAARIPVTFIATVQAGHAARQRLELGGVPVLVVGIPLGAAAASYIEAFPLREIDRTFRFLSWMLGLGVLLSGLAGAALGRWATGRALRPLASLTDAAGAAAAGDLGVRLPESDPDLATLATTFNLTAQRLQNRVSRDARFAGDVGHELRSPLTTMINALAVLQRRRSELSPTSQEALDLLGSDLARFRTMVDDLLEISRTSDQAEPDGLEHVDLSELVTHALDHLHVGAHVAIELPPDAVTVRADPRRIERALANLVANAEHHGRGLRAVRVRRVEGRVRVEVDDAGPGVAESERERIFERFARGRSEGRTPADGGSGLGLALVAQHVRRHGGRNWVESAPSGGARFVIELPEVPR